MVPEPKPQVDTFYKALRELYNVSEDLSQSNVLAAKHPEKLMELQLLLLKKAESSRSCRSTIDCSSCEWIENCGSSR